MTENETAEKVMVVTGRAEDIAEFVEAVRSCLLDNFTLEVAEPIEKEVGVDKKLRFIGFVSGEEMGSYTFENAAFRLDSEFQYHGTEAFPSMEDAFKYANDEFGFGTEEVEKLEKLREIAERFPSFTATEVDQFDVFYALFHTGKFQVVRALFDDEPVVLIAKITATDSDINIAPLAVLVTDAISQRLEYKWDTEEE